MGPAPPKRRWFLGELRGCSAPCGQELSGVDPREQRAEGRGHRWKGGSVQGSGRSRRERGQQGLGTPGTVRMREGPSVTTQWAPSTAESLDWEPGTVRVGVRAGVWAGVLPDCSFPCVLLSLPPSLTDAEAECTDPPILFPWILSVLSPIPAPWGWPLVGEFEMCVARGTRVGGGHPSGSALAQGLAGHVRRGSPSPVAATTTLDADEAPGAPSCTLFCASLTVGGPACVVASGSPPVSPKSIKTDRAKGLGSVMNCREGEGKGAGMEEEGGDGHHLWERLPTATHTSAPLDHGTQTPGGLRTFCPRPSPKGGIAALPPWRWACI